jgi:hypothetical protein
VNLWEFKCQRCDNWLCSPLSMNQTIWDAEAVGWRIGPMEGLTPINVLCPEHNPAPSDEFSWEVECHDCDYVEDFADEDEASEAAFDHEQGGCDCSHFTSVNSPAKQRKRQEKWKDALVESERKAKEREAHERYVEFLIYQDRNRKKELDLQDPVDTRKQHKRFVLLFAAIAICALLVVLAGCGVDKYTEKFQDAERGENNSGSADTITFPDGFSNVATKCDHGNRLYVLFHEDKPYGGISVVPNAEGC